MDYHLTTNIIIEYGNTVFPNRKIISHLPNIKYQLSMYIYQKCLKPVWVSLIKRK